MGASRFPMDAAMLTRNAAKAQQDYISDRKGRFAPGLWTYLIIILFAVGLGLWMLFR